MLDEAELTVGAQATPSACASVIGSVDRNVCSWAALLLGDASLLRFFPACAAGDG